MAQLVLHQIPKDQITTYLTYLAYRALKPIGSLLIVNLHPKYLRYLTEHEPRKFEKTSETDDRLFGKYHFDSNGESDVDSRNIEVQLAMSLGLGFDLVKVTPIITDSIADQKPRYRNLADNGIPMFHLMHLKKNPVNFISSTEGVVQNIRPHESRWVEITFADSEEIRIPMFSNWEKVKPNNYLILHETHRKEIATTTLNFWIVDQEEKITGGQLVAHKK